MNLFFANTLLATKAALIACLLIGTNTANANELNRESAYSLLEAFGPWPQTMPQDAGNELSGAAWAEHLGEQLFSETAFSGDNTRSCASCHDRGKAFTDGLSVAVGAGTHVRNTQGLLDVGHQRWFGWDGGTDSLWAASLRPMLDAKELDGNIPLIASRLRQMPAVMTPLHEAGFSTENDESLVVLASKAIAAYMRTLRSERTPFDRFRDAWLSGNAGSTDYPETARRGLSLFFGVGNCHVCHFGANFSNREFHDTGRPFFTGVGQIDSGRYSGIQRVRSDPYNLQGKYNGTGIAAEISKTRTVTLSQVNFGQWRTPSLRNLPYTAPYMHDGSLATLRDVVDAYADIDPDRIHSDGEAIIRPLELSEQDRQDLVAFLESLSAPESRD